MRRLPVVPERGGEDDPKPDVDDDLSGDHPVRMSRREMKETDKIEHATKPSEDSSDHRLRIAYRPLRRSRIERTDLKRRARASAALHTDASARLHTGRGPRDHLPR